MSKNVTVLISTFNGENYFSEQIESIIYQTHKDFNILIRDDGSTNESFINLLKETEKQYNQVIVFYESNIGVTNSNFELLRKCPDNADFVVFADQDDVWYPTRLEDTIKYIDRENENLPLLCLSKFEYVDENLNYISTSPDYRHIGFNNALVQNLATGCAICLNNAALKIILSYFPKNAVIHDWWMYLIVSATGKVIQEPNISIKYRQHLNNILGGTTSSLKINHKRIKRNLNRLIYSVYKQADEFYKNYYYLISEDIRLRTERFLRTDKSRLAKVKFLFNFNTVKRERMFDNFLLKIIILLSKVSKN